MSRRATDFRPLARMGWGGKAASHWRGMLSSSTDPPMPAQYPQELGFNWRGQIGTVIYRSPGVQKSYTLTGVTKDSTGAALAACRVELYTTADDLPRDAVVSDGSGNFTLHSPNPAAGPFYLVAYKPGAPDVAGTSVNTLTSA